MLNSFSQLFFLVFGLGACLGSAERHDALNSDYLVHKRKHFQSSHVTDDFWYGEVSVGWVPQPSVLPEDDCSPCVFFCSSCSSTGLRLMLSVLGSMPKHQPSDGMGLAHWNQLHHRTTWSRHLASKGRQREAAQRNRGNPGFLPASPRLPGFPGSSGLHG